MTRSYVDDFVKTNADFQKVVGFVPQITRIYHGKGCRFCTERQYSYIAEANYGGKCYLHISNTLTSQLKSSKTKEVFVYRAR